MPESDPQPGLPLSELRIRLIRSRGPGGQNVNKVNSKAVLRWDVARTKSLPDAIRRRFLARFHRRISAAGELMITSQRFRDAGRNIADCLEKLRRMLAEAASTPKPRKPTRPPQAARRRRLEAKRHRSLRLRGRRGETEP